MGTDFSVIFEIQYILHIYVDFIKKCSCFLQQLQTLLDQDEILFLT